MPSQIDQLLDSLSEAEFSALLDAAEPDADTRWLGLLDLERKRQCGGVLASSEVDAAAVFALAHEVFGSGNGAGWQSVATTPPSYLVLRRAQQAWLVRVAESISIEACGPLGRLNLQRLRQTLARPAADPVALPADLEELRESLTGGQSAGDRSAIDALLIDYGDRVLQMIRLPFAPRLLLISERAFKAGNAQPWQATELLGQNLLRALIGRVLDAGFATDIEPFPQSEVEFDAIIDQLRLLPEADLDSRLRIGGFASRPIAGADGPMRCSECIYFLPNRRWCDLPELPMPVEADWFCRLWKL